MTFERWIILILAIVLIIALAVGMVTYLREEVAKAKMEAQISVQQTQIDSLAKSIQNRDSEASKAIQSVRQQAARVKTPQQAAEAIPDISGLPVTFRPLPISDNNPSAEGLYTVAGPDVLSLYQKLAVCSEHDLMLAACQGNYGDLQKQADLLKQQRDAAVNTVRGGTFWHRFYTNWKWIGAIAGASVLSYEAGKQHH